MKCEERHDAYLEETCAGCGLHVDQYGNTEESFDYCCFPDCGCDGARLCIAPSGPNFCSSVINIERGSLKSLRNKDA